jgi:golgi apparatus protein 1
MPCSVQSVGVSVITLNGWIAMAAILSIFVVVISLAVVVYRRVVGIDKPYTLILKEGDV